MTTLGLAFAQSGVLYPFFGAAVVSGAAALVYEVV